MTTRTGTQVYLVLGPKTGHHDTAVWVKTSEFSEIVQRHTHHSLYKQEKKGHNQRKKSGNRASTTSGAD